jgi:hypothetical protein
VVVEFDGRHWEDSVARLGGSLEAGDPDPEA